MNKDTVFACDNCGKKYTYKRTSRANRPRQHNFCSQECGWEYKKRQVTVACAQCGAPKVVKLSEKERTEHQFCSRKCYGEFTKKEPESVTLECYVCGKSFTRLQAHHRSWGKQWGRTCCSRSCAQKLANDEYGKDAPFRHFLSGMGAGRRSRKSSKPIEVTVTLEDLKEQWERQGGVCPYSGVKLTLKKSKRRGPKEPYQASVDRIDSSKGYVPGNIEYVAVIANYAKNSFSKETLIEFCKAVARHQGGNHA